MPDPRDEVIRELRETIDDLWECIAKPEIGHLFLRTVEVARENHQLLWHANPTDVVIE